MMCFKKFFFKFSVIFLVVFIFINREFKMMFNIMYYDFIICLKIECICKI